MLAKLFGVLLLLGGAFLGFTILVTLIGTALGILFFLLKIAVPVFLVYLGCRLLFSECSRYARWQVLPEPERSAREPEIWAFVKPL